MQKIVNFVSLKNFALPYARRVGDGANEAKKLHRNLFPEPQKNVTAPQFNLSNKMDRINYP
jgi:hypothetical protein